jgi:uncharacterized protein YutE (UPF0331/DUF86 family)
MGKKHTGESIADAGVHLEHARKQFEKSQVDWYEPSDPGSCVTNAFYAYENAVVAAAIAVSEDWEEDHAQKRKLAKKLHTNGHLATDVSALLDQLNRLRKDVSYGEPGSELRRLDLEGLVNDLESFIEEVETLLLRLDEV